MCVCYDSFEFSIPLISPFPSHPNLDLFFNLLEECFNLKSFRKNKTETNFLWHTKRTPGWICRQGNCDDSLIKINIEIKKSGDGEVRFIFVIIFLFQQNLIISRPPNNVCAHFHNFDLK